MKSALCLLLSLMLLLPGIALGEENAVTSNPEQAEVQLISRPLPIDFSGGFAPDPEGYGEYSYEDPTISVHITYKETREYLSGYKDRNMGYWVVDVRIGDASQLRTAAAESFTTETSLPVEAIANRVNAVVAVNGDFFVRHREGFAIRQGKLYRDSLRGFRDILLIDEHGDLHVTHESKKGTLSDTIDGKKVINAFYFGPILVEDGKVQTQMPDFSFLGPEEYYARLALCQIDHLHYKLIITTMIQDYTMGIRLSDFAKLCQSEGAQIAYNLDGGSSCALYFHGRRLNEQKRVNFRDISDILYFASAWNGVEE